mmetsp:Transcript_26978/g.89508  ORF Transcript_26978/g.89508 Transcript_26978/m.89508 type:complete len:355 (+) Transcript_26978:36-1100(+)
MPMAAIRLLGTGAVGGLLLRQFRPTAGVTSAAAVAARRTQVGIAPVSWQVAAVPPRHFAVARGGGSLQAVGAATEGRGLRSTSSAAESSASSAAALSTSPLWRSVAVFGVLNLLGLGVSLATGSHLHLDLIGTGAFAVAAATTFGPDLRSQLSAGVVSLWAIRLTSFLVYRALQIGHDARLDATLSSVGGSIAFWFISFMWGVVTLLPHSVGAGCSQRPKMGFGAYAALALCAFGLYWEVASDLQKWFFKLDPANKGCFCNVGLWAWSQHPNYFGNLCLWAGLFLLNASPLARAGPAPLVLGALSPLFLAALFYGQASGTIMNSTALATQKYSSDPVFAAYVKQVPLVIPWRFW